MYVCMYVCMYAHGASCIDMHVCMYVCMYVCMRMAHRAWTQTLNVNVCKYAYTLSFFFTHHIFLRKTFGAMVEDV
jgi:hypothetical protein